MASDNITTWASLILGTYGACLSTVLAILHWQRDRGKFSLNPEVLKIEVMDQRMITWRLMEVVNVGRRPLYLEDFGFARMNGELVSMRDREKETRFPLKLDEGQKHKSMTVEDEYASSDIKSLWARDTTGTVYYSGSFPFGKDT